MLGQARVTSSCYQRGQQLPGHGAAKGWTEAPKVPRHEGWRWDCTWDRAGAQVCIRLLRHWERNRMWDWLQAKILRWDPRSLSISRTALSQCNMLYCITAFSFPLFFSHFSFPSLSPLGWPPLSLPSIIFSLLSSFFLLYFPLQFSLSWDYLFLSPSS